MTCGSPCNEVVSVGKLAPPLFLQGAHEKYDFAMDVLSRSITQSIPQSLPQSIPSDVEEVLLSIGIIENDEETVPSNCEALILYIGRIHRSKRYRK